MDITVAKQDLLKLVTRMQGVAERKSTMPVLSNVLLAVDGPNALRIAGPAEIEAALAARGMVEVTCEFCNRRYTFGPDEARALLAQTPDPGATST